MSIKILSFNIWDVPFHLSKNRHERVHRLGSYLKENDADIVCLQESWDVKHRNRLHETLDRRIYNINEGSGHTRRVLFFKRLASNGGLVNFSKFPIKNSKFIPFRRFIDLVPSEFVARKGVLATTIETPEGRLFLMNTHFHPGNSSLDRKIRLKQLRQVFKAAEDVKDTPILIAGDLNEKDIFEQKEFSSLIESAGFRDAAENQKEKNKPTVRVDNPIEKEKIFYRGNFSRRVDYFLVNDWEKFGWRISDYKVSDQPTEPISDHDPIMINTSYSANKEEPPVRLHHLRHQNQIIHQR